MSLCTCRHTGATSVSDTFSEFWLHFGSGLGVTERSVRESVNYWFLTRRRTDAILPILTDWPRTSLGTISQQQSRSWTPALGARPLPATERRVSHPHPPARCETTYSYILNTLGYGLNLTQRPKQLNYGIHTPPSSLSCAKGQSPRRSRRRQRACGEDPNDAARGREREGGG